MIHGSGNLVDLALTYASLGWKVYPIQPPKDGSCTCRKGLDCTDPGKHPFYELGGMGSASNDPEQLERLIGSRDTSLGILCDRSFWVLDCDGEKGLADLQALVDRNSELPETPTVETGGGGKHFYFAADSRIARNPVKIKGTSMDVRSKGGAVVAPPSLHASGRSYRWTTPPETPLAAAPEWLIDWILSKPEATGSYVFEDLDLETAPGAGEGSRNDQLCRLVGRYLGRFGETPDLLQLAMDWGNRCDPPMDSKQVEKTVAHLVAKDTNNQEGGNSRERSRLDDSFDLYVRSFREIDPKPIDWLWNGRLALGKITLLTGDGGVGKSMLTCDWASRISQGIAFPDGGVATIGDVFFIGAEDGAEDTVRPRLDAAGANIDRVHLIQGPKRKEDEIASVLDLSRHIRQLDRLLTDRPGAKLVIIDPIMDYLGEATNSDKATDVRRVLGPLRSLAEKHQVAIVAMNHLNKNGRGSKTRSLGSGAFVQVARIELRVVEDPDDPDRRLLLPVKNNLGAISGLAFRIQTGANGSGYVAWEDGIVDITIGEVESEELEQGGTAIEEVAEWLRCLLSDGKVKASTVHKEAGKLRFSESTLKRAKKKIGAIAKQSDRNWFWMLPEDGDSEEGSTEGEESLTESETEFVF